MHQRSVGDVISDCRIGEDIRYALGKFSSDNDMGTFMLGYAGPNIQGAPLWIDNHPLTQHELADLSERDPVLAKVKQALKLPISKSFMWSEEDYKNANMPELYEYAKSRGFYWGMVRTIPLSNDRRVMISIDSDRHIGRTEKSLRSLFAEFDAYCEGLAAAAVGLYDRRAELLERLTFREREALKWASEGHTPYTISGKMGLPCCVIDEVLASAQIKIGASSIVYAYVRAAQLGLFEF